VHDYVSDYRYLLIIGCSNRESKRFSSNMHLEAARHNNGL